MYVFNSFSFRFYFLSHIYIKTTYTYCIQLLETYGKLCEADSRRLPRNIGLSKTRLFRIWPKLTDRLLELQARTEAAKKVYVTTDMVCNVYI